ncbi:MAG: type II secretion system F family protein [Acidobacteria bacterium]|nr:type II secretion system F family protein [Acidobacteriota bacterium]
MLLKILAIVLLFGAVMLFVRYAYESLSNWWLRQIQTYASWMAIEFESMFEDMTIERAQRFITFVIFGSLFVGWLIGGWWLAIIFGIGGYLLPRQFVNYKRRKRLRTIDDQMIDALHLMANSLKSGLNLQQALELVFREMKPPISDEFGRVVKEIHLGRLTDDALRRFAERVPLDDIKLTIDSILMLRETGGNLSETFGVIATTVVERKKVEGKIRAMTSQGMMQGLIMCAMPIVMMLLFTFIDPNYMRPFFTTPIGWMLMALVFVLDGLGMWMMLKLVKVDV